MAEDTGTFQPLGESDRRMHGRTALLVCGFGADEQRALLDLLTGCDLGSLPVVFVMDDHRETALHELARLPDRTGIGSASTLRRALVLSGLTEGELHAVMDVYRKSQLPRSLWAAVTPVSEKWTIGELLNELHQEREALRQAREAQGN